MTRPRRPDPPPLKTDDRHVAAAGTAAWAVALVVLLIVDLPKDDHWWVWVCAAGVGIGLFAYWYLPRLHRGRAAAEERRAAKAAEALPGAQQPTEQASAADETPKAAPPT